MSDKPRPFVGYIDLGQLPETTRDEVLGRMLSPENNIPTYVHSSAANGKLDPILISPAEFFDAWRSAQVEAELEDEDRLDRNGWRLAKMEPFQIRVSDEDKRRDPHRLSRRKIGVPHWVYVLKADLAPPPADCTRVIPKGFHTTKEEALKATCIAWIGSLPSQPIQKRDDLKTKAIEKFKGLSGRQFIAAWDEAAPAEWKRAGRRSPN